MIAGGGIGGLATAIGLAAKYFRGPMLLAIPALTTLQQWLRHFAELDAHHFCCHTAQISLPRDSGISRDGQKGHTMLSRLTFLLLLAATSSAMGGQATMGDVSVKLPPPPGFCDLTDTNPSDKRMLSIVGGLLTQSGNKLMSMSADCQQLADWRSARRRLLDDYAQYQASLAMIDKPPAEPVAQTCATLRTEGNKIVSNEMPDLKARVEAALKNVKMNETTFIGVLAEEPRACYAGLIQQIQTEPGKNKTQLSLFAVTAVKNRTVFVYRFTVHKGSDTVVDGLAKLKRDVAAFHAAN